MADTLRYRLDFAVPSGHDINETEEIARNPTLDFIRASLAADRRWERSMLAPWRPFGQEQHLIVWVDLTKPESEIVLREDVSRIVGDALPGVSLVGIVKNPF